MARSTGIGIQSFSEIMEKNIFYVDKTGFLKEWWESNDKVTLVTRPRRFGKTLTLSMTENFFSIKYKDRGNLFEGLSIWKEEAYRQLQGTYPVIFLSFANVKATNFADARESVNRFLVSLYQHNRFLIEEGFLNGKDAEFFEQISHDMTNATATIALYNLSDYFCRYYGKKPLILMDEYDTPMHEAYTHGYWEQMAGFMRTLFNSTFKTNPFFERALITGITRVTKESMFSDLNHLRVASVTTKKYETAFGFTEDEVFRALDEYGLRDERREVKRWYDGFRFGTHDSIYNPWSIINFLAEKEYRPYWVNTSANQLVSDLIQKGGSDLKLEMESLLLGKPIQAAVDEDIVFQHLGNKRVVWSLLLASGYFKATDVSTNRRGEYLYTLDLVNWEVRQMFEKMFIRWFSSESWDFTSFSDALINGDRDSMNRYLNDYVYQTLSYYDTGRAYSRSDIHENFYHGLILGLISDLRYDYVITSNRESGTGRCDVMLKPRSDGEDGIILEFKVLDPKTEKTLEDAAASALRQIVEKGYAATLKAEGIPEENIRIYGFAFTGKSALVDGGQIGLYTHVCT